MIQPQIPKDQFAKLLDSAIRQEIDKAMDTEVERAKASIEKVIRASVGAIAAKVLNNFSYERMGQDLVIRVQFAFPTATANQNPGEIYRPSNPLA